MGNWSATGGLTGYFAGTGVCYFDVTNTTTHKVQFAMWQQGNSISILGDPNSNYTYMIFKRLGDT